MGTSYFYCINNNCGARQPIEKIGETLDGKHLCRNCYDKGFRLKFGVIVYKKKDSH